MSLFIDSVHFVGSRDVTYKIVYSDRSTCEVRRSRRNNYTYFVFEEAIHTSLASKKMELANNWMRNLR